MTHYFEHMIVLGMKWEVKNGEKYTAANIAEFRRCGRYNACGDRETKNEASTKGTPQPGLLTFVLVAGAPRISSMIAQRRDSRATTARKREFSLFF